MKRFSLALMLGLSLLSLAQVAPSAANPADSCNFSRHIDYSLVVAPSRDCVGQTLSLVVHSCRECDHILSGAQADDGSLYLQFQSQLVCPVGVYCRDDSLVIPLRPLSPGTHSIEVHASASVITGLPDTTTCNLEQIDHFTFDVLSCPGTLPFVSDVQIGDRPDGTVCPRDSIPVSVYVEMPSRCFRFLGLRLAPSDETVIGPPVVEVLVDACPTCFYCPPEPIPYVAKVVLPPLPLGAYHLRVREIWSGQADSTFNAVYPFSVVDACSTSGSFPMVKVVEIGGPACPSCPLQVCPGDSVRVFISGEFPSTCWEFHGVDVLPDSFGGSRPPRLRVNLYRDGCNPRPCAAVVVPFYAALRLPPLAPGSYVLDVEEQQVVDCGPQQNFPHRVRFQVADQCSTGTPSACLMEGWVHGADRCDAHVSPDHPGDVEMTLVSHGLPLAGLQGELHFLQIDTSVQPVPLQIVQVAPVGRAATWKMAWTPIPGGVRFVMFSADGSIIPPDVRTLPSPVLKVTVAQVGPQTPPPEVYLAATGLQGSDPEGHQVPPCPMLDRFALPTARICTGGRLCDFNLDGIADIRDLVLMVNCLFGVGVCPDSSASSLDCNGDGHKSVDDLLCCASVVLHGGMPDSTPGRNEPNVQVSVGSPVRNGSRLDVPIRVDGAERLGAGRLVLRFPSDRFDFGSVETSASDWLSLGEANGSDLVIGLIGLRGPQPAHPPLGPLNLTLHLELKPGQEAGGELKLSTGEFSGPDGVALKVPLAPAVIPMDGRPRLVMAPPQPNPFSRETRFSVTLPAGSARLEVTVHDLAGRRIATLFRDGIVSVPEHVGSFTVPVRWAGTDDSGARVRDGIYFVHVRAGGNQVTSKIILLRGN